MIAALLETDMNHPVAMALASPSCGSYLIFVVLIAVPTKAILVHGVVARVPAVFET